MKPSFQGFTVNLMLKSGFDVEIKIKWQMPTPGSSKTLQ